MKDEKEYEKKEEVEVKEIEDTDLDEASGGLQDIGNGCSGWGCPCPSPIQPAEV